MDVKNVRGIYLWLDDLRPAPVGYVWVKSVQEAKNR